MSGHPLSTIKVQIRCRSCGFHVDLCVPISRPAPDPLRCNPGGPAGVAGPGGAVCCGQCRQRWFVSSDELRRAVEAEIRGGWGRHLRDGTVLIACG